MKKRFDKVVSLDLETTGYSSKKDKILEIGAVLYDPVTSDSTCFSSLIKVSKVPGHITALTGISADMCKDALSLKDAVLDFMLFVFLQSDRPLFVGHNLDFDQSFLNPELKRYRTPQPITKFNTWDTMLQMRAEIAKKKTRTFVQTQQQARTYRTKDSVNLGAAAKHYKVPHLENHRALPDAETTLQIFLKQLNKSRYRLF